MPTEPRPATINLQSSQPSYLMETHSLKRQAASQGAQRFGFALTWPPMTRQEAGPALGFLLAQEGRANAFKYAPHTMASPMGAGLEGAQEAAQNLLAWSERLELSPWAYNYPTETQIAGTTTAPNGDATAQLWEVDAACTYDWPLIKQDLGVKTGLLTCSVYVKNSDAVKFYLILASLTSGKSVLTSIAWTGAVASQSNISTSPAPTAYGLEALANGWYRVWVAVDLTAAGMTGESIQTCIYPRPLQPGLTRGQYVWGAQVEPGVLAPGPYLRTYGAAGARVAGPRGSSPTNLIEVSSNFTDSYWLKACAVDPYTGPVYKRSILAPDGISQAQSWGTPANNSIYGGCLSCSPLPSCAATQYVASVYVKKDLADTVGINLREAGAGVTHMAEVTFDAAGVASVINYAGGADAVGLESVGSGWYRVWVMVDAADRGIAGENLQVYLYPHREDDGTPRAAEGTYFWGAQLEAGRTTPGHYLPRASSADPFIKLPSGSQVETEGWAPGTAGVLLTGDLIKFENHSKVYMVTADANADANGNALLSVKPALMELVLNTTAIQLENIEFTVSLAADVLESPTAQDGYTTIAAQFVEVL
jgi:hypothetical protein